MEMTQDEIIRTAREAGFTPNGSTTVLPMTDYASHGISYELERFAALVAAHVKLKNAAAYYEEGYEAGQHDERDACAVLCLQTGIKHPQQTGQEACAAAIRERGEK